MLGAVLPMTSWQLNFPKDFNLTDFRTNLPPSNPVLGDTFENIQVLRRSHGDLQCVVIHLSYSNQPIKTN